MALTAMFYDKRAFHVERYGLLRDDPQELITYAVAVLMCDVDAQRKRAAILLLKALVREDFCRFLLSDTHNLYPYRRDDPRVARWRRDVISAGKCERCGTTEALEAHHIARWAEYPPGRADRKNGACLCHLCHTKEHEGEPAYSMMKAGMRE